MVGVRLAFALSMAQLVHLKGTDYFSLTSFPKAVFCASTSALYTRLCHINA